MSIITGCHLNLVCWTTSDMQLSSASMSITDKTNNWLVSNTKCYQPLTTSHFTNLQLAYSEHNIIKHNHHNSNWVLELDSPGNIIKGPTSSPESSGKWRKDETGGWLSLAAFSALCFLLCHGTVGRATDTISLTWYDAHKLRQFSTTKLLASAPQQLTLHHRPTPPRLLALCCRRSPPMTSLLPSDICQTSSVPLIRVPTHLLKDNVDFLSPFIVNCNRVVAAFSLRHVKSFFR